VIGTSKSARPWIPRTDIHRLFDRGCVTVTPNHQFRVSERLREDYANRRTCYGLDGQVVRVPPGDGEKPSRDLLAWHGEAVFFR
jgi:putative restriction endonuclease